MKITSITIAPNGRIFGVDEATNDVYVWFEAEDRKLWYWISFVEFVQKFEIMADKNKLRKILGA